MAGEDQRALHAHFISHWHFHQVIDKLNQVRTIGCAGGILNTNNLKISVCILIMSILLSSCGSGQFLGPTITPTLTPTLTPTFTPTSTSTPEPTHTPTFTSTPSCAYYPDLPCYNGSYYELGYANPPATWDKAVALANSKDIEVCESAHLATVTTAEEQVVIRNLMERINENGWLGGFQPANELSLADGWEWHTGEPFVYTNWSPTSPNSSLGEPNDSPYGAYIPGSEQSLEIYPDSGFWNDALRNEPKYYYIVEYEDCY